MDDENISLTNPTRGSRSSTTLYLWWGLNVALVVFVFLAFLFSTLSYAHSKHLAKEVNNSFVTQMGGLIQQTYKVYSKFSVNKGQAVSFCATNEICSGLGPEWGEPFFGTGSATPAVMAGIAQLSKSYSLYAHVVESDHSTIRFSLLSTSPPNVVLGTATFSTGDTVTDLMAVTTSNPNVGVVYYSSHNQSYLLAAVIRADMKNIDLATPLEIFSTDPATGVLRTDVVHSGNWILVTYGYDHQACKYLAYAVDTSAGTKLRKVDVNMQQFITTSIGTLASAALNGTKPGWFIQANANSAKLGWMDYANNKVETYANTALGGYYFDSLTITAAYEHYLVISGVQVEYVDQPLVLSFVVKWSETSPYLTVYPPVNLLGTQNHMLLRDQLSVCYLPPYDQEPYGGLFYAYVDAQSLRAKVMRVRTAEVNDQLQILPSPSIDISTIQYGKHGSWLAPLLSCPTAQNQVLVALQDFYSIFNTFSWKGGFRYAGVAQSSANEGKDVNVVRQGISTGHVGLIPGFRYYMYNNGTLAPYTSLIEIFTPNGFPFHVGVALTDTSLFLQDDVFDRWY